MEDAIESTKALIAKYEAEVARLGESEPSLHANIRGLKKALRSLETTGGM